jgi:hypothetical protein
MALKVWVLVGFMMVSGLSVAHAATYDATGDWTYTTSNNWVNAGTAGCWADSDETTVVSITQSGDNVSVDIDGQVFTGTVSDAAYTGTGSYPEDGGTTTVTVTFTLTSNSEGSGSVVWSWSDGMYSCNGGADLSLSKNSASTPYDATGAWTYTTSGNWVNAGTAGCSADSNETLTVTATQSGTSVSVVIRGQSYSGTVSGATYTGTASWPEDGGTTTETVTFTLTSDSVGSGTVVWSWSDGAESCNGGSNISLAKSSSGNSDDSDGDGGGGSGCLINSLFGN